MPNKHQSIILHPYGGLANRMRAIDSAIALCRASGRHLNIFWPRGPGLQARFDALFEKMTVPNVTLREATFWDHLALDAPERWNLKLPRLFQAILFGNCAVRQPEIKLRLQAGLPIEYFSADSPVRYVSSGMQMLSTEDRYCAFRPIPPIQQRIEAAVRLFKNMRCWGVHIRRTDHQQAINHSPTKLFIERMNRALDTDECDAFYLATDCEDTRYQLKKLFAERLFTLDRPTTRESIEGMQDAVQEMWTLAETSKIFGSLGSTYAETAAWMNNRPYESLSS